MKRTFLFGALFALLVFCTVPSFTFATDACEEAGVNDELICGSSNSDEEIALMNRIRGVLNTVYLWIGIISVIVVVIGGIQYMTSNGEAEKIKRAKASILYSLCGLIVTLSAFAITTLVINSLSGTTVSDGSEGDDSSLFKDRDKVKRISAIGDTSLIVGQSATIKTKVIPDYAKNKDLSYKTSDESIATVDQKGKVKAKKEGDATITISSSDGPSAKVVIHVKKPIPVTSIKLSSKDVSLKKGESTTIKATPSPSNATDKTLIWASEDSSIATVTQAGKIKAIKDSGSTKVTVTARNQESIARATPSARLADYELVVNNTTPIKETVNVSIVGKELDFSYKGNGSVKAQFSSANMRIIEKHLNDFNYYTYHDVLNKKYGGKFENYAKDVGGIFGDYYGKTIKVKNEYEFQMASEYVFGWMYMIGFDYESEHYYGKWGSGGGDTHSSDAFFPGTMRYQGAWGGKGLDKALASTDGHDRAMMTQCGPTIDMIYEKVGVDRNSMVKNNTVKYITRFKDLKVGDKFNLFDNPVKKNPASPTERWSIWTNGRHVAMVGEVYKDHIVIYDGGSYYMNNRKYKRTLKIPDTEAGEYAEIRREFGHGGWSAERFLNLTK